MRVGVTDRIEAFILELMKQDDDEWLTIQRNELADIFGCVPSQINYVISTRFSPERGYVVESRRGGGGCVRIKHIPSVGTEEELSEDEALIEIARLLSAGYTDRAGAELMKAVVCDELLSDVHGAGKVRASILNNMKKASVKNRR